MKDRSWQPFREGKTYCAPACGGGCTFAQYTAMKNHAKEMCKELGRGWEISLTHNLGWYCAVVKGNTKIHYYDDRTGGMRPPYYSAWIEVNLGDQTFQFIHDSKSLKRALSKAVTEARGLMERIKKEISSLKI